MPQTTVAGPPPLASSWARARRAFSGWTAVQRGFFWLGLAQFAVAGVHAVAYLLLGGSLEGPVSIRKPIVFSQAFGGVSLSLAFIIHDLGLPPRLVAPFGWFGIAVSAIEVALATLQFWRGVPSHFNYATLFDGLVAGTMTTGALLFAAFLVVLCVAALRPGHEGDSAARGSLAYGVRLSLPLAAFGLSLVGLVMLLNGGRDWRGWEVLVDSVRGFRLGAYNGQAAGPGGGDLMLVHALSTHVLQVLPVFAWWVGRGGAPERLWRPRVRAMAAAYAGLILIATAMALT